ncbi:hypothetical protein Cantr_03237 [Candida viswanathii]|uniref:Uncharacterized protein n=1 Tax=Candida viswanathii TaxID=5486 RepID=A0A367YPX6_9ASCO|nr:hypothetical protein Cantr_03237 [Candida viswanathii]
MSQVSLLEFQDYLIYSQTFNSLLESESSSASQMQPNSMNTFAPPPAIALEPSMQDDGVPKRSPARLFDRWRSKDKKGAAPPQQQQHTENSKVQPSQSLKQRLPQPALPPQPIITKQEIPVKKFDRSEPSSPLSLASTDNNSSLSSSAGSIFSDSKNNNSTQLLLLDDIDDILEDIDDAEIYDAEKVTITYISSSLCSTREL